MDVSWVRARFADARVARLATASPDGRPHLVPIVFALLGDDRLCFAVDAKPKSGAPLRRLTNILGNPLVSVLVDHYDEDWRQLWWARADGSARVVAGAAPEALVGRYPQYQVTPPPGPVVEITVNHWSGWSGG
ncbi:TIGR03668 family PPOX class F420-dependent oxidoreductase [Luedemannella flava]